MCGMNTPTLSRNGCGIAMTDALSRRGGGGEIREKSMASQTILFIVMPRSINLNPDTLPVSVYVSPRLFGDTLLGAFPDWLQWTQRLQQGGLSLTFHCKAQNFTADISTEPLRSPSPSKAIPKSRPCSATSAFRSGEIGFDRGVGVMVGEASVAVGEDRVMLAREPFHTSPLENRPGGAIAGVPADAESAAFEPIDQAVDIGIERAFTSSKEPLALAPLTGGGSACPGLGSRARRSSFRRAAS